MEQGKSNFIEEIKTGLDTNNSGAVSQSIDLRDARKLGIGVVGKTGAHANHILTIQCSPNDTDWFNNAATITGTGVVQDVEIDMRYCRVKVTTPEGGTSTCDVYLQAK